MPVHQGAVSRSHSGISKGTNYESGSIVPSGGIGASYAKLGKRAEALQTVNSMEELGNKVYVSPVYVGIIYDSLGEPDTEFQYYAKSCDDRSEYLLWLTLDPIFDHVRGDPRFSDLVKKVGVAK